MVPDKKTILESIEVLLDSVVEPEGEEFSIDGENSGFSHPFTFVLLAKPKEVTDYSLVGINFCTEESVLGEARDKRTYFAKNDYVAIKVNKIYGEIIYE